MMNQAMFQKLKHVCEAFCIRGTLDSYKEIKRGNINNTYKINVTNEDGISKSYMVQMVNTVVFKEPVKVMENIDHVTEYMHAKDPHRKVLHFHHTADRKTYVFDENGFWRLFNYVSSSTYDKVDDLEIVESGGEAFGDFQVQLRDFDAAILHETIPGFHNTVSRYNQLENAIAADPYARVEWVQEEIDWLRSVRDKACTLTRLYEENRLPLRVTHNDTKINNVLFEKDGKRALVVVDLDTVMPGLVGHDFGDAIRFAANKVEEDCPDAGKAGIDMEIFRAFTRGFLSQVGRYLTQMELDTLAISCFDLTCELAIRFLEDYLMGDVYFKTHRPGHNLDRTRCQIALAKDMERHMYEMEQVVRECAAAARA